MIRSFRNIIRYLRRIISSVPRELEQARMSARKARLNLNRSILFYAPRRPASFPHNGRTLIDDVVEVFFSMLTNGKVTIDKVGPHGDLLDEFPYLGPPH